MLKKAAIKLRKKIEKIDKDKWGHNGPFRKFSSFPNGCCVITSHILARYLIREYGLKDNIKIIHGEHPNEHWHYWVEVNGCIVDITADQFEFFKGCPIIVGETDWHKKCRILETWSPSSEFTVIEEGADYAGIEPLEYLYGHLIKYQTK